MLQRSIPMALHADGVQVTGLGKTWSRGMEAWSVSSLLKQGGSSGLANAIFALLPQDFVEQNGEELMRVLKWSLQAMMAGAWPRRDSRGRQWRQNTLAARVAGTPLAGGWKGVPLCIRGDLDFVLKGLRGANYNSNSPCSLCACNDGSIPWNDLRPSALWRRHHRVLRSPCPLFSDNFLHLGRLAPDWMHSKHLGTDAYLAGSVLTLLAYDMMSHGCN